jgi:hypothetical protein
MNFFIIGLCIVWLAFYSKVLSAELIDHDAEIARLWDENHRLWCEIHKLEKED